MGCASTLPKHGKAPGWICTGENLVALMSITRDGKAVPCVVPADRVAMMMSTAHASAFEFDPKPYGNSGDHMHMHLPQRVVVDWLDGVLREYLAEAAVYAHRGGESVLEIYGSAPGSGAILAPPGVTVTSERRPLLAAVPLRSVREWRWEGR